ncbi:MAG: hydantoinase B/oxoprolinase family protein [Actinomycetota bacterium]|nr:hydantoinase B/oxoprolinase family protein [Actinomycetota bacterium]
MDPVTLSVMAGALAGIAEEMGVVLVRSSYSSNIKERRDCSTALFDARGRMVAQAEHIPVHLGAMPEAVAAVIDRNPEPGDVFIVNDPFTGGTHLPDITLVSAIAGSDEEVIAYGVTRAHHSDIGGKSSGSMPADSRSIFEEGLIIPPVRLVCRGEPVADVLELVLANVRTPAVRRGDLKAQLAANRVAEIRLNELLDRPDAPPAPIIFDEVISYAERLTRGLLGELPDGVAEAASELEGDGVTDADIPIRVRVEISADQLRVDFAGTSGPVAGNVNCPVPVTRSACFFALRVLAGAGIPANAGAYAPLEVLIPEPSLLAAPRPSAVVAGNVETSQRIADTVLAALAQLVDFLPAQGQGTMNNVIIGGEDWTYYETIGGGQGATGAGPGPSGVHVGMTNTLNTPIEAFELEYPMRVERYELRYGSGGDGRHEGGDGIERSIRVLAPASASLLSDRRRHAPAGMAGGLPGRVGENLLNGEPVAPKAALSLAPGDVLTVRTPGGGGWGQA